MTAEIAIINRFGIALAADSAVTIGDERVWKTTNKLFSLGPNHDIGIMIYGGGTYLGCPWDTVIKEFREATKNTDFRFVHEVIPSFFEFLRQPRWGTDEDDLLSIVRLIVKELDEYAGSFDDLNDDGAKLKRLTQLIDLEQKKISSSDISFEFDINEFETAFFDYVDHLVDKLFDFDVPNEVKSLMLAYMYAYASRAENVSNHETGIVFCGFGRDEIYPVLIEAFMDGRFKGIVRWWKARSYDFNAERGQLGTVVPFAQRDMTNIFMEGISHTFVQFFHTVIESVLRKKTDRLISKLEPDQDKRKDLLKRERKVDSKFLEAIFDTFLNLRHRESIQPLMSAIRSLPREEMSAMAEALVELTSLRRKIDSRVQSVAGPVDVAFISKGDGFVWMKRKYYFDGSLNQDYEIRRKKKLG